MNNALSIELLWHSHCVVDPNFSYFYIFPSIKLYGQPKYWTTALNCARPSELRTNWTRYAPKLRVSKVGELEIGIRTSVSNFRKMEDYQVNNVGIFSTSPPRRGGKRKEYPQNGNTNGDEGPKCDPRVSSIFNSMF